MGEDLGGGKEVAERLTVYVDCLSPLGKELKILNQPYAVRVDLGDNCRGLLRTTVLLETKRRDYHKRSGRVIL